MRQNKQTPRDPYHQQHQHQQPAQESQTRPHHEVVQLGQFVLSRAAQHPLKTGTSVVRNASVKANRARPNDWVFSAGTDSNHTTGHLVPQGGKIANS